MLSLRIKTFYTFIWSRFIRWTLCGRSNHYKAQYGGACEDNPSVDILRTSDRNNRIVLDHISIWTVSFVFYVTENYT